MTKTNSAAQDYLNRLIQQDDTTGGIYEITNLANGKRYVGSAKSFRSRWYRHIRLLNEGLHHSIILQRAWNKHGAAEFVFKKLEVVHDAADLLAREQHYLDAMAPEYNVALKAGSSLGVKRRPETIEKLTVARRKRGPGHGRTPDGEARRISAITGDNHWTQRRAFTAESNARKSAAVTQWHKDNPHPLARPIIATGPPPAEPQQFLSIAEAANALNINRSTISFALRTGKNTKGFSWQYAALPLI